MISAGLGVNVATRDKPVTLAQIGRLELGTRRRISCICSTGMNISGCFLTSRPNLFHVGALYTRARGY